MILVKNLVLPHLTFRVQLGQKESFATFLIQKKTFLDYKNVDIRKWKKLHFFAKGLLHDFGQKF